MNNKVERATKLEETKFLLLCLLSLRNISSVYVEYCLKISDGPLHENTINTCQQ